MESRTQNFEFEQDLKKGPSSPGSSQKDIELSGKVYDLFQELSACTFWNSLDADQSTTGIAE